MVARIMEMVEHPRRELLKKSRRRALGVPRLQKAMNRPRAKTIGMKSNFGSFYRLNAIDFAISSPHTNHSISISRAAIDD
jgi:hypothetical protein